VNRGEIWVGADAGYASKPRPSVIIQDDLFAGTDSVTVCLLTSRDDPTPLARVPVPADEISGLDLPSWVMIDKIMTVRRAKLARHVGRLTAPQLLDVERRVLVFLGIAG
jgi:mRNA interferase MazF